MSKARRASGARAVFAANVRRRRKALGLSQDRFAHEAGVHRTYVGAVERCEKNICLDNIEKFAAALGCDPGELLNDEGASQTASPKTQGGE